MTRNRIAALRREAGLNQKELGQKLGVGQTTVSAWEIGRNEPDNAALNRMAQLFHVSIGYLTGYEEDNGRRGLSEPEYRAAMKEAHEKAEKLRFEREREREEKKEQEAKFGVTEEEIEELFRNELLNEWEQSGQDCFFETYQIGKYFEFLTEEQRSRVVTVVEQMFPLAVLGMYTDEQPRK